MPELSVILCSHNPRPDYLEATLRSLAAQTLARERWELRLIDSASSPSISADRARLGHPGGRVVREETPGCVAARLRGVAETESPLIVLVDDDSLLDPDYLERALALSVKWPDLGVWSGQVIGRYEEEPADWLQPWCRLAVRELERDAWSNSLDDACAMPSGAGLCVRRSVADFHRKSVEENPLRRQLDRAGIRLDDGHHHDLAFTSAKMGLGRGLFRELKLQRLIPAQHAQPEHLLNLLRSTTYTYQLLLHLHQLPTTAEKEWTWWQRWNRLRHVAPRERPFLLAQHDGHVRAADLIAALTENPAQPVKNFRAFEQTPLRWTGESTSPLSSAHPARPHRSTPTPQQEERRQMAARLTQQMEAPGGGTTKIFIDWIWHEMSGYLSRHRCLFCGPDAALLKALYEMPEYRQIAKRFWPESATVFFLPSRHDGKSLAEAFEAIRADIAADIDRLQVDTVFLDLAGTASISAPIPAHDLAKEKGVRVFDFGGLIRVLTYSGSDGPALVRVPFELYMRALQTAHPGIDPVTLISKAHAQLARELVSQEPQPAAADPSRENRKRFYESYAVYRRHYYPWANKRPETRPLLREFRQWRLAQGLGLDGRAYQLARTLYRRITPAFSS